MSDPKTFDPWALVEALERHRVNYVLIGSLAGVLHGTDGVTTKLEICPQLKADNLERLEVALSEAAGTPASGVADRLAAGSAVAMTTPVGEINVDPRPTGSAGWDDLRRAATREALGRGLRATVGGVADLARLSASQQEPRDGDQLELLRRIAELELRRGVVR